jgi:hypothetical protein
MGSTFYYKQFAWWNFNLFILRLSLVTVNSELHRAVIGVTTKSAEVLSKEFEELCWEKGSLGFSTPTILQHTVFFYIGLYSGLPPFLTENV